MITFWGKRQKKKQQNRATTVISVDGKGTVFPVMLKLQWGIVWIKVLKKRILKKI